jgi:hypothetical protein
MARANMDEKVETLESSEDALQKPGSSTPATVRTVDLNELQQFSEKKLKALARDLDLHLHPTRSRHQHILDIVRAAVAGSAIVSAEGFLDKAIHSRCCAGRN